LFNAFKIESVLSDVPYVFDVFDIMTKKSKQRFMLASMPLSTNFTIFLVVNSFRDPEMMR
jgi:hypothetical protein